MEKNTITVKMTKNTTNHPNPIFSKKSSGFIKRIKNGNNISIGENTKDIMITSRISLALCFMFWPSSNNRLALKPQPRLGLYCLIEFLTHIFFVQPPARGGGSGDFVSLNLR